jgi:O-antigen ligase
MRPRSRINRNGVQEYVMTFSPTGSLIYLNPLWLGIGLLFCVYIILSGRPELSIAMQMAILGWTRNVMVGPVVQTYVLLLVSVLAVLVRLYLHPDEFRQLLPKHNRWIAGWMLLWWAWMFLLIFLFDPRRSEIYRSDMLNFFVVPLPIILTFVSDARRVQHFAVAYLITMVIGGFTQLSYLELTIVDVLRDPSLNSYDIQNFELFNYHRFAWAFGSAIILAAAIFMRVRNILLSSLILIMAGLSGYFLLLAGSRQTMAGTLVALSFFLIWAFFYPRASRVRLLLLSIVILGIGIPLYLQSPELVIRSNEDNLAEAFDLVSDRGQYWEIGWNAFRDSPIWGSGFTVEFTHNLFFGTLAQQGLVGMIFLSGYLLFLFYQSRVIFSARGSEEGAVWRVAGICIIIFGLVHSMASGTVINMRHVYWAGAILWGQAVLVGAPPQPVIPYATRFVSRRREASI